jgi:hypothetical protein
MYSMTIDAAAIRLTDTILGDDGPDLEQTLKAIAANIGVLHIAYAPLCSQKSEDANLLSAICTGSVATILTKDARRWWAGSDRSCGPVEQVGDKGGLAADIMTVNLSNLSLPHHRHGLETRQRLPRRTETAEAEPRPDKALDTPVILLDDVVQIFTLSQTSAAP